MTLYLRVVPPKRRDKFGYAFMTLVALCVILLFQLWPSIPLDMDSSMLSPEYHKEETRTVNDNSSPSKNKQPEIKMFDPIPFKEGTSYGGNLTYDTPPSSYDSLIGKTEIIAFCNYNFRSVALTWYRRMTELGYTTHVIVSTDAAMVEFLRTKTDFRYEVLLHEPMPLELQNQPKNLRGRSILQLLMAIRWKFLLQKLESGVHFLLTDVDNIFNRYMDMENEMELQDPTIDIYHAYATKYPLKVFEKQGFVVCSGMSWWRASPAAIRFARIMHEECGILCDDQRVFNFLLVDETKIGMTWHWTPEANASRIDEINDTRVSGLLTVGITGTSKATGHKARIWDRDFAYRGPIEERQCPKMNWVSMPNIKAKKRSSAWMSKIKSMHDWDRICGSDLRPLAK